jgi:hypothetical protein
MKLKIKAVLLTVATLVTGFSLTAQMAPIAAAKGAAVEVYGKAPLSFEPTGDSRRFLAHSGEYSVSVGAREASVTVGDGKSGKSETMLVAFDHANGAAAVEAIEPLPGVTNYYVGQDAGKWRLGVKNYAKVRAQGIYPGVDVVYYGDHRRLEFDFVVAPKADANAIALSFSGMEKLYKDASGDLIAEVNGKPVRFVKPFAYQIAAGVSKPVPVEYELASAGSVHLRLGAYDRKAELIIDPVVSYATYLGGSQGDVANGIAVDSLGSAYITGQTCSSKGFPLTTIASPNPSNFTFEGACDAFVTKFSADGTGVVYTTIIGGSTPAGATAAGYGIALDSAKQAYIVGATNIADLPGTIAATTPVSSTKSYQGGDSDAFIVILDASGNFVRSAYLGGSGADAGYGIAVDQSGNVIVVGQTSSDDFPSYGGFETKIEHYVAFFTKLDNALDVASKVDGTINPYASALTPAPASSGSKTYYFSGFYGGHSVAPSPTAGAWQQLTAYPQGAIVVDTQNPPNVEIALNAGTSGPYTPATTTTSIPIPNWSTTLGAITIDGSINWKNYGLAYVAPADAYSEAYGVALDPPGDVYLVGGTDSGSIPSIYWPCHYSAGAGAWVLKVYGTTGGCAYEWTLETNVTDPSLQIDTARAVAVDASSRAYVTGTMSGSLRTQSTTSGLADAFIVRINSQGSGIDYARYLGGSGKDQGLGVAVDGDFQAYVTGSTQSTDFPLINSLQNPNTSENLPLSGSQGAFIAKLTPDGSALIFSSYLGGSQSDQGNAIAVDPTNLGNMYVAGNTTSTDLLTTLLLPMLAPNYVAPQMTNAGNGDAFVAMIPGGSIPTVTTSPGSLNFAAQDLYTTSAPQAVTYSIEGTSTVHITGISFSDGEFAQSFLGGVGGNSADCVGGNAAIIPSLVPPTVSGCTVWVVFTPTQAGARQGTLTISDDTSSKSHSINLNGVGAVPNDVFSAPNIAFSSQIESTTSNPSSVKLTNNGQGILDISTIVITGAEFTLSSASTCAAGEQLASGSSCTISVTFTPSGIGLRTGTLTITDNAPNSPHNISLTGTGAGVGAPTITPTSLLLAFGNQPLKSIGGPLQVTVANSAGANLVIGSVAISGANASDFSETDNCSTAVLPSGNCVINVSFTPGALGSRTASLVITDNAVNSPQSITLTGTGIATGAIAFSPTTVAFGSLQQGTNSGDTTVTLTNNSTASVTITSLSISGSTDFVVDSTTCPAVSFALASSGSCTLKLKFSPTAAGAESATLTAVSSGSSATVALSGTGTTTSTGADYTLTSNPTTGIQVTQGGTATFVLSMASVSNFTGTITFGCTSISGGTAPVVCSFSPATVTMNGTNAPTTTLSINTNASPSARLSPLPGSRSIFFALLPFSMMGMLLMGKRRRFGLALVLLVLALAMGLASCGSSSGSSQRGALSPGSYQFVVNATSNGTPAVTHSLTLNLVVSQQ